MSNYISKEKVIIKSVKHNSIYYLWQNVYVDRMDVIAFSETRLPHLKVVFKLNEDSI